MGEKSAVPASNSAGVYFHLYFLYDRRRIQVALAINRLLRTILRQA